MPTQSNEAAAAAPAQPCCPVCRGPVILLRGDYRCSRCCFTFCLSCEAASPDSYAHEVPSG